MAIHIGHTHTYSQMHALSGSLTPPPPPDDKSSTFIHITGLLPLDAKDGKRSSDGFVIKNGLHVTHSTDGELEATYHSDDC